MPIRPCKPIPQWTDMGTKAPLTPNSEVIPSQRSSPPVHNGSRLAWDKRCCIEDRGKMRTVAKMTAGVVVLLALDGCSNDDSTLGGPPGASMKAADAKTEGAETQRDPDQWASQQFNEERWGAPGVVRTSGGMGPGAGLEFTPKKAGWYDIGMACEGATSLTVTVTAAGNVLGTGSTDCGSEVTTKMELPGSKVSVAVEATEVNGNWAMAVAPTDAP